ncbi:hypothetical protein HPB51_022749 [Rhipicephalus microplus]|uniref:Cytochrome n=1 Tax=Rhipicephalus microplus TaxID=6941 RepID=A0A9J6EJT3_RHIMP|nr:hypothetical protein HPB51_022749 [Rhipicephalus microplus]
MSASAAVHYVLIIGKLVAAIGLAIIIYLCAKLTCQWIRMYYYLRHVPRVKEKWPFSLLLDTWMALRKMDRNLPITAKFFNYLEDITSKVYEQDVAIAYYGPQPFLLGVSPTVFEAILSSNVNLNKSFIYRMMKPWMGNGVLTSLAASIISRVLKVFNWSDTLYYMTQEGKSFLKKARYIREYNEKESLRLYPPVPLVARNIDEDMRIGKYTIPKGTVAACAIYFLHRHPKVYKDPNTFMPERFMDNRNVSPFAFVPFSAGSRNCIGQRFAQLEEKIMLTHILRNFRVESLRSVLKGYLSLRLPSQPRPTSLFFLRSIGSIPVFAFHTRVGAANG